MTEQISLQESYSGTFDGNLEPGSNIAVLVVDMVMAYLDPASALFCETAEKALNVTARLADAARAGGYPVILTGVEYETGGANGGLFYRKVPALKAFQKGSPGCEFPEKLGPSEQDWILTKQMPSAFFDTGLAERLKSANVDTLIITGFSTSGCVRASALDALQHGFAPFVVRDGCADRHRAPHESNLFDLQSKYAEVIDSAAAIRLLGAD